MTTRTDQAMAGITSAVTAPVTKAVITSAPPAVIIINAADSRYLAADWSDDASEFANRLGTVSSAAKRRRRGLVCAHHAVSVSVVIWRHPAELGHV